MNNIGVVKGQPFRFGTFDREVAEHESTTISFISDPSLEQSKSAPPISRVKARDAFLSVDLALCKLLFESYSNPTEDTHAAGLWKSIDPRVNTLIFVNRQYVLTQIRQIVPSELDDARKKLECRKLLSSLESAWNTSILYPELIPSLLCAAGWNARTQRLYTMPYRSLPIGRVESVGSPSTRRVGIERIEGGNREDIYNEVLEGRATGLIYKAETYVHGSFNVDLTASESPLSSPSTGSRIYLVYVDSLGSIKADASWPELLADKTSDVLSAFEKSAHILVIDSASRLQIYNKALGRQLQTDNKPFDHILPCCSFRQQELLARLRIDTLSSSIQETASRNLGEHDADVSDLAAITRVFHDLYPAYTPGESLPTAIISRAMDQFGLSAKEHPQGLVLSGRAEVPTDSSSPSVFYMVYGLLRQLVESIINETSCRLIVRRSDLDQQTYDQIRDGNNGTAARVTRISSQSDSISCVGLDLASALEILRELSHKDLENPYKLIKLVDPHKANSIQDGNRCMLSILLLEDY